MKTFPPARRKASAAVQAPKAHARLPLAALRVFAAVAARRSFSSAAELLNLSTAAVSMQIKTLEQYLEVRLFLRGPHHVELTAEGERLVPFVERGLGELEQGFRLLRADRGGGALVVSMLPSFLHSWLLPRLPRFHAAHPEIDLRLQCTPELADFGRAEVHAAIRVGEGRWPNLHAEKLFDEWLIPVCAPALLARHGMLEGPGTTRDYPLLHSISEPWTMWLEGATLRTCRTDAGWPASGAAFDDSVAILSAAVQGRGLVLARWSLADAFITSGQLVPACGAVIPHSFDAWFVCPTGYLQMRKVERFREWLVDEARRAARPGVIVPAVARPQTAV
jgi:DNA-binding transcriptional LysR family regulator